MAMTSPQAPPTAHELQRMAGVFQWVYRGFMLLCVIVGVIASIVGFFIKLDSVADDLEKEARERNDSLRTELLDKIGDIQTWQQNTQTQLLTFSSSQTTQATNIAETKQNTIELQKALQSIGERTLRLELQSQPDAPLGRVKP